MENQIKLELGKEAKNSLYLLGELQHNDVEIPETGWNAYSKYKYPLLDDILDAIQPYLRANRCIVLWSEDEHEHDVTHGDTLDDGYYIGTDVIVTCRIQYIDNIYDYVQSQSHGYGLCKNGDKTLKAQTIARRFSLMCLLGMQKLKAEDTDDSEHDPQQFTTTPKSKPQQSKPKAMSFKDRMTQRSTLSKRSASDLLM